MEVDGVRFFRATQKPDRPKSPTNKCDKSINGKSKEDKSQYSNIESASQLKGFEFNENTAPRTDAI